ncbi:hypothetical protein OROGR_018721 [Orobanche gracilis]
MKKSMLILLATFLTFFISISSGQSSKYCPGPPIPYRGSCGINGNFNCHISVYGHYSGNYDKVKDIKCVDVVGKNISVCTFQVLCGLDNKME